MHYLKEMLCRRGISFWFMLASFVLALAALVLYLLTGTNDFTPSLSGKVICLFSLSLAGAALFSVLEVKAGKYAVYLIGLGAWLEFIISQVNYLTNIFVSIDGSTFSSGFILTFICGALAWAFALVSAIAQKKELGSSDQKMDAPKGTEDANVC